MIYLDNAATTPLIPEVIETMTRVMENTFGNPSSTHTFGREAKSIVETARKKIAAHFNVSANEIIFTAGGSEADNLILYNAIHHLGIKTIISSPLEHHAVLHTLEYFKKTNEIKVLQVNILPDAGVDYTHLEQLLFENPEPKLVSLMYVNNETGTLLNLDKVSRLCKQFHAYFHSDTVQGIGHYLMDLKKIPIDFVAASAHKFHGPKGVGFAIVKKGIHFRPVIHGGEQEHGLRAGTENVHNIAGMEKALEIAYQNLEKDRVYIEDLKDYFVAGLQHILPDITFNAQSHQHASNAYHILNVRFPKAIDMFLFKLDLKGIAASGGSACQSGSQKGSHVLKTILNEEEAAKTSVRFSFSKLNTKKELDLAITAIQALVHV